MTHRRSKRPMGAVALATATVVLTLTLAACASAGKTAGETFTVVFSDYRERELRLYLRDERGNDFEEVYDMVTMTLVGETRYVKTSFDVVLDEEPVRPQFRSASAVKARIAESVLLEHIAGGSDYLHASDISFVE